MKDVIFDPATKFNFNAAEFVPFKDKEVCDRVRKLSGKDLGEELLFPSTALRADGEVFLDDVTPKELSEKLGVPATPAESDGQSFICAVLGLKN